MSYAIQLDGKGWRAVNGPEDVGADEVFSATPPRETMEQTVAQYTVVIQRYLDDFARTRNYDGILSACTYATSTVPTFAAEGQYCVSARDETWAMGYQILSAVQAGERPIPTEAELLAELPALAWPV